MIGLYLTDTATLTTVVLDEWNEPTKTTETISCRFVYKSRLVFDSHTGENVQTTGHVDMKSSSYLDHTSRLTVDGRECRIVSVEKPKDFGDRYIRAWVV